MASQTQGIQQLLQAEKRAAEKVAEARKRKARRLKQAQTRKKLQAMHGGQARGKDQVLRHLLTTVWNVQPQIHPNYRLSV
ncbi:V-type proton ATPase subunit G 2 isoform X2 [Pseudonaja textilis]|uniref:V-type proton ATPase subunit G 2 isoform X2 n=1 Tax=Notechis scutatus TaxID=8663 RepID=A0A6J1VHX3_9SAUR|nr:V-type proton ATPase subunit G 2 isoform X2 [Notechis scutatus]XP_026575875.1 V-type proton ATPase subunit G 2 isoform X2 [Pseudonaja textilis]